MHNENLICRAFTTYRTNTYIIDTVVYVNLYHFTRARLLRRKLLFIEIDRDLTKLIL